MAIQRDEWQHVYGPVSAQRAAEFFSIPLADAVVERLPDDPRLPEEPVWRVKRKSQEAIPMPSAEEIERLED